MQDWYSAIPEPLRSVVIAVIATVAGVIGLNRVASSRAEKDMEAGVGPAAGAVLKQSIDKLSDTMDGTNVKLDRLIDAQRETNNMAGRMANEQKDQTAILRSIDRSLERLSWIEKK